MFKININKKRLAQNLLLLIGSLLFCLIILEVALRIVAVNPNAQILGPKIVEFDSNLGWGYIPNSIVEFKSTESKGEIRINSMRFRDAERSIEKNSEFRVAVLGDSYMFGDNLNTEQRFSNILEAEADNCEFLNFGVAGYSTDQELLLLRSKVLAYKPDLVIIGLYLGNDVEDNFVPFPQHTKTSKPFFEDINGMLVLKNFPVQEQGSTAPEEHRYFLLELKRWLSQNLYSYHFLVNLLRSFPPTNDFLVSMEMAAHDYTPELNLTVKIMNEIKAEAERNNAALIVLMVPTIDQLQKSSDKRNPWLPYLENKFSENGIEYINLLAEFKKRPGGQFFFPLDEHLNQQGNELIAALLEGKIRQEFGKCFG